MEHLITHDIFMREAQIQGVKADRAQRIWETVLPEDCALSLNAFSEKYFAAEKPVWVALELSEFSDEVLKRYADAINREVFRRLGHRKRLLTTM